MSDEKIVEMAWWKEVHGAGEPEDGGPGGPGGPGDEGGGDHVPIPTWCSDDALAVALVRMLKGDWRHINAEDAWLRWNGVKWDRDEVELIYDLARENCRSFSGQCKDQRLARQVSSARAINATIRLAGTDPEVAARAALFDADPMLLNTPGGIVDLRDGRLGPHRRDAYMTRIAAAGPVGDCPLFDRFLGEFTLGNSDYRQYLLRLAGYCLTGSIKEHVLVFLWGAFGGEGKGVFARVLHDVMGDYAGVAMMGMFMVSYGERHPTEIAALVGKRLVIATETQQGQEWDEAKLKAISGGDPITARVSRGDPFTFAPNFKLVMSGNHKPRMRSADGAMRRRLHLLPCEHHPAAPDLDLEDKLRAEHGGILKRMIEGAVEWRALGGLKPPAVVTAATNLYFAEQNPVVRWFAECCEATPIDFEAGTPMQTRALYQDFKAWMAEVGEKAWGENRFTDRLRTIPGVVYHRDRRKDKNNRGWHGLRLKAMREEFDLLGEGKRS